VAQIPGDLGGEVIKIEPPESDIMRYAGPTRPRDVGHVVRNLDCNQRPLAMAPLGFAWEQLQQVSPRLVYRSVQGYGPIGPLANRGAFNDIFQGGCGLVSLEVGTGNDAPFRADLDRRQDRRVDDDLCGAGSTAAAGTYRPLLGEHSRAILCEAGFAEPEIADLFAREIAIEAGSGYSAAAKTSAGTRSMW
jgi:crotonobetainyl-CoA:carnitine CoA-transferase CaiB-like acyl-CoA transferase